MPLLSKTITNNNMETVKKINVCKEVREMEIGQTKIYPRSWNKRVIEAKRLALDYLSPVEAKFSVKKDKLNSKTIIKRIM